MPPKKEKPPGKGVAQVIKKARPAKKTDGYHAEKLDDLKADLRNRGAPVSGKKDVLIARLEELDSQGKTEKDSAKLAGKGKATASKKSAGTTAQKPASKKTSTIQAPRKVGRTTKKATPTNSFRSGSGSGSGSPTSGAVDDALNKTKGGKVTKATAAEKARASKYRATVNEIMKKMRDEQGGSAATVRASVFKKVYNLLVQAVDGLDDIEQAKTVEKPVVEEHEEGEAEVPAAFDAEEEVKEGEATSPAANDPEAGGYVASESSEEE